MVRLGWGRLTNAGSDRSQTHSRGGFRALGSFNLQPPSDCNQLGIQVGTTGWGRNNQPRTARSPQGRQERSTGLYHGHAIRRVSRGVWIVTVAAHDAGTWAHLWLASWRANRATRRASGPLRSHYSAGGRANQERTVAHDPAYGRVLQSGKCLRRRETITRASTHL